jgi:hypothetical protein
MHCHPLSVVLTLNLHHKFGGNHPCWLDPWQKNFYSLSFTCFGKDSWLLFIVTALVPFHRSRALILWPVYLHYSVGSGSYLDPPLPHSFQGKISDNCIHKKTTYIICQQRDQSTCFDAQYSSTEEWLETWNYPTQGDYLERGQLIYKAQLSNLKQQVLVSFDACGSIDYVWLAYVLPCKCLDWDCEYRLKDK